LYGRAAVTPLEKNHAILRLIYPAGPARCAVLLRSRTGLDARVQAFAPTF